jgi:hypothetical protein
MIREQPSPIAFQEQVVVNIVDLDNPIFPELNLTAEQILLA